MLSCLYVLYCIAPSLIVVFTGSVAVLAVIYIIIFFSGSLPGLVINFFINCYYKYLKPAPSGEISDKE